MTDDLNKILIVDSSDEFIWTICNVLEGAGLSVDAVTNGKDAVEFMRCSPQTPVVVLNCQLPDMNAISLLDIIRQNGADPKVIIVTSYRISEIRKRYIKERVWKFIEKPFNIVKLLELCKKGLADSLATGL